MCDDCAQPSPPQPGLDRRRFLAYGVLGSGLAVAGWLGLDTMVGAAPPVFERAAMGEDLTRSIAPLPAARRRGTKSVPKVRSVAPPRIITRAEWGADESMRDDHPAFAPIRKIVVHHTASPGRPSSPASMVRLVQQDHVVGNGWSDIGYNFLIDHRGNIYEGRWARDYAPGEVHNGEDTGGYGVVGAHAQGVNAGTVGICLIGNFENDQPTNAMLNSLVQLIAWKASRHQVDPIASERYLSLYGEQKTFPNISGHRQVGQTLCPGQHMFDLLPSIRATVASIVGRFPPATIDMAANLRYGDGSKASLGSGKPIRPAAPIAGYRVVTADGKVVPIGKATSTEAPRDRGLREVVAASSTGDGGFVTINRGGLVQAFHGARGFGGLPGRTTSAPAIDISSRPNGDGYWILTNDGVVHAFGAAKNLGSPKRPTVKVRSTPSGNGYWTLMADGRLLEFGDARTISVGPVVSARPVDFWPTPTGRGGWVLDVNGRVVALGDAKNLGSAPLAGSAVGILGTPTGGGYAVLGSDGGVVAFGDALASGRKDPRPGKAVDFFAVYA